MEKINIDLSFLSQPALNPPKASEDASQPGDPTTNPLDRVLPAPEQLSVPVSEPDSSMEPERPSRWATDAQVLEWKVKVKQLENELRTLETSQTWSEVETDHSQLEEYQRRANALELSAERLQGTEKAIFVEAQRAEFGALSESIRLAKVGRHEHERKLALLEPIQTALAQVQALLMADRLDTEEAAERLARYARLYGAGQGASV